MGHRVHLSGYQARDYQVIDYHMYELGGTGLHFRGPEKAVLKPKSYFSCIGAAQTFGCFCERPFPDLISESTGLANLNLGYGGAGPEFFNNQPDLLPYINKGRFLILQVMSGRSQSNSEFEAGGLEYLTRRRDGVKLGAHQAYRELIEGSKLIRSMPPARVTRFLARILAFPKLKSVVDETRKNWLRNYFELIEKIEVPIILLWFSKREPDYPMDFKSVGGVFGEFPQMINQQVLEEVKKRCSDYAMVTSSRGSPQPLFDRFSHEPTTVDPVNDRTDLGGGEHWTHNIYYPSPEMHEDAAEALLPVCKKYCAS